MPPYKFKVGDKVRVIREGDGTGARSGGPIVGTVCTIDIVDAGQGRACGPYRLVYGGSDAWWTTENHIEFEDRRDSVARTKMDVWKVAAAVAGVAERVLYDGPPGTGKTYAAQRFGVRDGQPVYNLTCTEEMPAAEIRGHFIPAGDRFVWMDGPGVKAMREGGRLVINEIEKASGDVQTLLLAILDDRESCALTLPTGETVLPAAGYTIAATMNGDADTDLPDALRSRFPVRLRIEEVHPDAIARLPKDLQHAAKQTGGMVEDERRITIRSWLEFARLRPVVGVEVAAAAVFGERSKDVMAAIKLDGARG